MQPGHEEYAFAAGMVIAICVSAGFALNDATTPDKYNSESYQAAISARSALEVQDKAVHYAKAASGPQSAPITAALASDPESNRTYDAAFQYLLMSCAANQDPKKITQLKSIVANYHQKKPQQIQHRQFDLTMRPVSERGQVVTNNKGQKLGVITSKGCEADAQTRLFGTKRGRQEAHANVANLRQLQELTKLALSLDAKVGAVKDLWAECMRSEHNFRVTSVEAAAAQDSGTTEAFDTASADCRTKVDYQAEMQLRRNAVETAISHDYPGVLSKHSILREVSIKNAHEVLDEAATAHHG